MDKRGVFGLLAAVMLFLLLTFAYLRLIEKQQQIPRELGEAQLALLKTAQQAEGNKLYTQQVFRYAVGETVLAMGKGAGDSCPSDALFPVWSTISQDSRTDCLMRKPELKSRFDTVLKTVLSDYQDTDGKKFCAVESSITEGAGSQIIITSLDPTLLRIPCGDTSCGEYQFRRTGVVDTPYRLTEFLTVQDLVLGTDGVVEKVQQCFSASDWQTCVAQTIDDADTAEFDFTTDCGIQTPPSPTVYACAITHQEFWHFDGKAAPEKVMYRFAIMV